MERGPARQPSEKFWRRVSIGGPDECWPWTGELNTGGYGLTSWHGIIMTTHRVAYELASGAKLPREKSSKTCVVVMHTCDSRLCCNPAHLRLGTHLDNRRDCVAKGRDNCARGDANGSRLYPERLKRGDENVSRKNPELLKRGSEHHNAGLNEDNVREIRRRVAAGEKSTPIAADFGITTALIWKIKVRRIWKHVD